MDQAAISFRIIFDDLAVIERPDNLIKADTVLKGFKQRMIGDGKLALNDAASYGPDIHWLSNLKPLL